MSGREREPPRLRRYRYSRRSRRNLTAKAEIFPREVCSSRVRVHSRAERFRWVWRKKGGVGGFGFNVSLERARDDGAALSLSLEDALRSSRHHSDTRASQGDASSKGCRGSAPTRERSGPFAVSLVFSHDEERSRAPIHSSSLMATTVLVVDADATSLRRTIRCLEWAAGAPARVKLDSNLRCKSLEFRGKRTPRDRSVGASRGHTSRRPPRPQIAFSFHARRPKKKNFRGSETTTSFFILKK